MGLFSKKRTSNDQAPMYTGPELEQFLDGFREGMPLVGQPEIPQHNTKPYKHGLRIGRWEHQKAGCPQIPYEESGEE
jgi:hypothetical protein